MLNCFSMAAVSRGNEGREGELEASLPAQHSEPRNRGQHRGPGEWSWDGPREPVRVRLRTGLLSRLVFRDTRVMVTGVARDTAGRRGAISRSSGVCSTLCIWFLFPRIRTFTEDERGQVMKTVGGSKEMRSPPSTPICKSNPTKQAAAPSPTSSSGLGLVTFHNTFCVLRILILTVDNVCRRRTVSGLLGSGPCRPGASMSVHLSRVRPSGLPLPLHEAHPPPSFSASSIFIFVCHFVISLFLSVQSSLNLPRTQNRCFLKMAFLCREQ